MLHNIVDLVDLESAEATVPKDKIEQLDAIKKSPGGIKLTERVVKQTYQYAARSVDYDLPFLDSAVCGEYEELDSYLQNGIRKKISNELFRCWSIRKGLMCFFTSCS